MNLKEQLTAEINILDFGANWCVYCRKIAQEFDEVLAECKNVKIIKIDTDKEPDLATEYGIEALPTLVFIKNGVEVHRFAGFTTAENLIEIIKSL